MFMLRITPTERGSHQVVLRIEGRISGPWVSELSKACERALGDGGTVVMDLAEVSFLDTAGIDLIVRLQIRGVEVVGCSMFVKEQLKAACMGAPPTGRSRRPLVSE